MVMNILDLVSVLEDEIKNGKDRLVDLVMEENYSKREVIKISAKIEAYQEILDAITNQ